MVGEPRNTPGSDAKLFFAEVAEVAPLRDRNRVPASRTPTRVAQPPSPTPSPTSPLHWERSGEEVSARSTGVSRRRLRSAARQSLEPGAILDLHGLSAKAADDKLRGFLGRHRGEGSSVLRIITGRGRHSEDGRAVLREQSCEILAALCPQVVLAFTSSDSAHGGAGALTVILRRSPATPAHDDKSTPFPTEKRR